MFLDSWLQAGLLVLGAFWCYKVIERLPEDIRKFHDIDDIVRKPSIIIIWAITGIIAILVVRSFIVIIGRIAISIRDYSLV